MRRLSAEAFVLDVRTLHDRDRVVTFLTADWGRKRGVARGALRKYSRFAGQLQPLAKVAIRWFEKEGRDLVRVEGVELIRPCRGLFEDLEGILLANCLAEHMVHFAQENEESADLFRLLEGSLEWLREGVERNVVTRYFETWVLRLAGIFPPPVSCPTCGRALGQRGAMLPRTADEILCRECALSAAGGGTRISPAAIAFLQSSARSAPPQMQGALAAGAVLAEVEGICGRVRRGFLQHELRSYEVMKATLERGQRTSAS